jgi:ribosomal protein L37AE/L43A
MLLQNAKHRHKCPVCGSPEVRRATRKTVFEVYILPLVKLHPYRCSECDKRFYARSEHAQRPLAI